MFYSNTKLVVVTTLIMLATTVCSSRENVALRVVTDAELACLLGSGCQNSTADPNFCVGTVCTPVGGGSISEVGTGAIKRWCGGTSGVCDCNQTGIPQTTCINEAVCAAPNCQQCGTYSPSSTVQTAVHLNGAPCSPTEGCGGA